jgi:hypothetical protein
MAEDIKIDYIKYIGNAIVAKSADRNYPGILIQGDSLRILLTDLSELSDEISSENLEDAKDIADSLQEKLKDILRLYEQALDENGISLPYMNPVQEEKKL